MEKRPTRCAVLHDVVVIQETNNLIVSSTSLDSLVPTSSPSINATLTTYKSKFMLIGGRLPLTHEVTSKVWTSTNGLDWEISLPAMPTRRFQASSVSGGFPEVLVVAGGFGSDFNYLDIVEVLIDNNWTTVDPLPATCSNSRMVLHKGNLYITGGNYNDEGVVYTCSFESLTASTSSNKTSKWPIWRRMQALGVIVAMVSYSSHLISINPKCNIDGYSNTTQSWLEISNADGVPQNGRWVTASVLSTGDLMVANGYGVFRVNSSVPILDLDKGFVSDALTRLEVVMRVQIESVLATKWEEFTSASGVIPQTREDRLKRKISVPDPQMHSVQYVQELIHQWSMGHSSRPSTWRELLQIIEDMGHLELRQQIETYLKGEVSYLEAYYHFIDTKESLNMLFLKFLFLGPPRHGKTTVRRRLLKEIVDLISAGEADQSQPSTGAVDSSDIVVTGVSGTTAVITESEWSALEGLADEARMLIHSLMDTIQNTPVPTTTSQPDDATVCDDYDEASSTPMNPSFSPSPPVPAETQQQLPALTPVPEIPSGHQETGLSQHIPEVSAILKEAMGSEHWKHVKHMFKAYMRMEDTGGQPELMDMLPALTLGPGLYLLFINLQNTLDHHYKLAYCNASGESTPPIESICSVKEMLLSSLSSISCSNEASLNRLKTSGPYMKNTLGTSKSVAFIVGTHKDKVSSEQIKKLDEDLKKVIIPTQFYEQDIVQFASDEDLIVAVDNMAGGSEEVQKIKKMLEDCMARHFKKLKIPAVWLFFSLYLRHHEKRTTTLDYCLQLSSSLGMSSHETEVALWFLHHHARVLMYFPNVPDLKDLVIIDVKVVYDSVTVLILQAMDYYKVGHSRAKTFKKTGKFTLSHLIAATSGVSGDHIPAHKLVILLEFLHIITPLSSHLPSSSSSSSKEEVTYMMPCVLRNATTKELDSISQKPKEVPPILFPFKCGAVPIGVFPALIACLTSNSSFTLIQDEVYKTAVQFHFGDFYTQLTLICRPTYYECIISEFSTAQALPHKECVSIRQEIEATLSIVSSRVNYGSFMDYEFAFDCPRHPTSGREHLCIVEKSKISSGIMLCLYNADSPKPIEMPTEYKVWFGEPLPCKQSREPTFTEISTVQYGTSDSNDSAVTIKELRLLERTTNDGSIEKLCILQEVCPNWKDIGMLVGLSPSRLTAIEMYRQLNPYQCCTDVFCDWLDNKGTDRYPVTWQGLCVLLTDLENIELVLTLKEFIRL